MRARGYVDGGTARVLAVRRVGRTIYLVAELLGGVRKGGITDEERATKPGLARLRPALVSVLPVGVRMGLCVSVNRCQQTTGICVARLRQNASFTVLLLYCPAFRHALTTPHQPTRKSTTGHTQAPHSTPLAKPAGAAS